MTWTSTFCPHLPGYGVIINQLTSWLLEWSCVIREYSCWETTWILMGKTNIETHSQTVCQGWMNWECSTLNKMSQSSPSSQCSVLQKRGWKTPRKQDLLNPHGVYTYELRDWGSMHMGLSQMGSWNWKEKWIRVGRDCSFVPSHQDLK